MRLIAIFFFLIICVCASAQGPAVSGSQPKSFSLLPDDLGFLTNSVNQFNGQVQFSMPIMGLNGTGKLSYNFSIDYSSSNLASTVSTWNREAPTGVLGLGWSFNMPKIVVDHNGTTNRDDDDFYFVENGSSNPLIYNGSGTYYTKNYTDWVIQYDHINELWTITKEDGTTYTYGDKNSTRFTVQYMVRWGNWIGNSSQPNNQQQMVYVWNLSEIKNLWNDKITFTYIQDLEYVAAGAGTTITTQKMHTKASYLSEIKNLNNEKISFVYNLKTVDSNYIEYQDTHTEKAEPDAYQEKYESKYLDRVVRYDETGTELFHVQFGYNGYLGAHEMAKRELSSITQYSALGNALPGLLFSYETSTASTAFTGALTSVQSPTKGTTSFTYNKAQLTNTHTTYQASQVTATVNSVAGVYEEPQFFFGEDYVVAARRFVPTSGGHSNAAQPVLLEVITWEGGRWIDQPLVRDGNNLPLLHAKIGPNGYWGNANFSVATGKDFFGVYSIEDKTIFLFKKDPKTAGLWLDFSLPLDEGAYPTLGVVSDYIFLASKEGTINSNKIFYFDPQPSIQNGNKNWSSVSLSKPLVSSSCQYFYSVEDNYLIIHRDNNSSDDILYFYFFTPSTTNVPSTTSYYFSLPFGTDGDSQWYPSNSFSVFLAAENGPHYPKIFYWDENYNVSIYDTYAQNGIYAYADSPFYVNNINNATTVFYNGGGAHAFRFDGTTWIWSTGIDYIGSSSGGWLYNALGAPVNLVIDQFSFDDDLIFRMRSCSQAGARVFDPNTLTWIDPASAQLSLSYSYCGYPLIAGSNFISAFDNLYYRNTDGTWQPSFLPPGFNIQHNFSEAGVDFINTVTNGNATPSQVVHIKNGVVALEDNYVTGDYSSNVGGSRNLLQPQAGYNILITEPENVTLRIDASKFNIYRKVNGVFGNSSTDNIYAFVVNSVSKNDGSQTVTTNYVYNQNTASVDANGVPQFNQTSTALGYNITGAWLEGYTTTSFFNGISSSDLVNMDPTSIALPTVASGIYKQLTGASYATLVYDYSTNTLVNNLIAKTITDYDCFDKFDKTFLNQATYYKPVSVEEDFIVSGTSTLISKKTTQLTYSANSTQLISKSVFDAAGSLLSAQSLKYYTDIPDYGVSPNLQGMPVWSFINSDGTGTTASRWKSWGAVPGQWQTYQWKSGSTGFDSYWNSNVTVPVSNWRLLNTINSIDLNRGLEREVVGSDGVINSTIWHSTKPLPLAKVKNAGIGQVYYQGFEYWTAGNTNSLNPLSGSKYYSFPAGGGTLTFNLSVSGDYVVSYWTRTGGSSGSWTLVENTFTGSSYSLTLSGVDVDEVRIHPSNAFMISYSYDRFGNIISSCDPNNMMTYFEYDEFNRLKLSRDEQGNILEYNAYNFKN